MNCPKCDHQYPFDRMDIGPGWKQCANTQCEHVFKPNSCKPVGEVPHLDLSLAEVTAGKSQFTVAAEYWTATLRGKLKPGEKITTQDVVLCRDLMKMAEQVQ